MTYDISNHDAVYVRAFSCGNERMQRECYRACRDTFSRIKGNLPAPEADRNDIFHESFEIMWGYIDSGRIFVEGAGVKLQHHDGSSTAVTDLTGAYFAGIVKNKFLEYCRQHNRIVPLPEEFLPEIATDPPGSITDDDIETLKDRLTRESLSSLAKSCVEILTKFYHESKSLTQILSERPENSSYDGLKTRKTKCLKTLKEKIITSFQAHGLTCP